MNRAFCVAVLIVSAVFLHDRFQRQGVAAGPTTSSSGIAQDEADISDWNFDYSYASPMNSALGNIEKYSVRIDIGADHPGTVITTIRKDEKSIFSWEGVPWMVFCISKNVLYYPAYGGSDYGGTIVAIDLLTGKELWRSDLEGLGINASHLFYSNHIGMDVGHKGLLIWGDETAGRYLEIKDFHTGKTIGHHIYKSPATTAPARPN